MEQTKKALEDFIKDNPKINYMIYFETDWQKHFYDTFVEWLANRYVVAKQNKYSNWFIFKEKILDCIRNNKSIPEFLEQIKG